ncbi:uncharacterized protein IWZ02DRAFT_70125 [Phyllosticta citriasiana]|uniref:uncharacterized protein n=1 Tax=Phyllosticta citriasiana TaxID=595635 RepID=UPI0030FD250A
MHACMHRATFIPSPVCWSRWMAFAFSLAVEFCRLLQCEYAQCKSVARCRTALLTYNPLRFDEMFLLNWSGRNVRKATLDRPRLDDRWLDAFSNSIFARRANLGSKISNGSPWVFPWSRHRPRCSGHPSRSPASSALLPVMFGGGTRAVESSRARSDWFVSSRNSFAESIRKCLWDSGIVEYA